MLQTVRQLEGRRPLVAAGCAVAGVILIVILYHALPHEYAAKLLDRGETFPFSVQNGMWIAFCIGLGELAVRQVAARAEMRQLKLGYLPEDERTILQADDLKDVYRRVRKSQEAKSRFLPRLIDRCVLQFQASNSTDQSASLLNTSVEMFLHEVDLRYNMLRYICWVIPSLGFIGTVVGIGRALHAAGLDGASNDPNLLSSVTSRLAVAFDGTFLALIMASILVFLQNVIQSREEHALNLGAQYCLDNLINRLYVPKSEFPR